MRHIVWIAILTLTTAACGDPQIFDRVAAPESPEVASKPYPKLADTPATPPAGDYTAAMPDPANGDVVLIELAAEATAAESRRSKIAGPVE